MIATLQLNNFFVDSFSFETNPFYDPKVKENRIPGQIGCSFEVRATREEGKIPYSIVFKVTIDPAKEKPSLDPYAIKFNIVGLFTLDGSLSDEERHRVLSLNGGTILYGIIRGIVAQTTGSGAFGKYIMPAINLVEIYDKRGKQAFQESKADVEKKKIPLGRKKARSTKKTKV